MGSIAPHPFGRAGVAGIWICQHPHPDAVQGSGEARSELYIEVLRVSTAAADAVMRRKSAGATGYAGWQGGRCRCWHAII